MTKQIALISAAVMSTLLALMMFWQFRVVVLYVLISLLLAATFRPISRSESRRNLRTRMVLTLQYIVVLAVVGLLIFIAGRFLAGDFQQLADALSQQTTWMVPSWLEGSFFQTTVLASIPTPDRLLDSVTSQRDLVFSAVLGITQSIGGLVSGFLIILFLSVYWSINQNHFERLWLSLLPAEVRKNARYVWRTVEHDLGAYSRSELIQSLLAGILLGVGYFLLGSPYPTLLAITGAIAWLIPLVGGVLAVILPFLLGLLTSPQLGLVTVIYTVVILSALQIWVEPRLFKLKLDNPIITFVILLAMSDAFGLPGLIAAPPVSVVFQIIWNMLVSDRLPTDATVHLSDLKEQQERLQQSIGEMEGTPPPLVTSSMERLAGLFEKSEPILKKSLPAKPREVFEPVQSNSSQDVGTKP